MPLKDVRLLPENNAAAAWNCDLNSGALNGLPAPELVKNLTAIAGTIKRAYRFPGPTPGVDPDVWLPLPSPFSSVVRGPLANDTLHRVYWTNPDGDGGFWNTYARIAAGSPNYTMGFLPVEAFWIPTIVTAGGSIPMDFANSVGVAAPGTGYTPGAVLGVPGGTLGVGQSPSQVLINQTQVVTVAIAAAGSGGTDGDAVIQGTSGTGVRFTAAVTIAGGGITSVSLISGGIYDTNPVLGFDPVTVISSGPVTSQTTISTGNSPGYQALLDQLIASGMSLAAAQALVPAGNFPTTTTTTTFTPAAPGTGLTGAAVSITMGILTASINFAGGYSLVPDNPVTPTNFGLGGGTGATMNLGYVHTGVPEVERSYLFTYVDQYGQESSPSVPSAVVSGASDGTWTVYGLSNVPPTSFSGGVYPNVVKIRIYRTITGATTGGNFYQVAEIAIPPGIDPSVGWVDTALDADIVNNNVLQSTSWAPPPAGLDGLTQLPGGMLVGFTENTIHFCEPNRPNVWPVSYDLSVNYQVVGLAVWQSSLVILTEGFPSTGSGSSPANFALSQVQVAEPCIARGSIIADLLGIYYASPNGICMLNYYGMQNQTQTLITKNQWLVEFNANAIIACRHRSQYLALDGIGAGFLIDYADQRSGLVHLNTFNAAVCIWNDVYSGDVYILANKIVYRWDSPNTPSMVWRWVSKRWLTPLPISLGACEIILDETISETAPPATPLDNGDTLMILPTGVNALFRLYRDDGVLVIERNLTKVTEIFRLPSGFKSFDWQFEILSRVPVFRVKLASSMAELRKP